MGFNNNRITQSKSIQGLKSVRNYAEGLSDFENGFNSLVGYSDGTTRPTGTFGGTAANLVKSIVATNPLVNSKSLKLTKTGACQGQGYYFDFTPVRADILSASVVTIKFKLEFITGTFTGSNDPSVDSDLIIGVWDAANSRIIEPSTRLIGGMVTGFVYDYKGEFQIPTNATTLKLFIHHARTGASTFEIVIDDFEVAANDGNSGPNLKGWRSYTPVVGYTNATATGFWRQVGDSIQCNVKLVFTGTPGGSGTFNNPAGYLIDTTKIVSGNPALGNAWAVIVATNRRITGTAVYASTSGVVLLGYDTAAGWGTTIPGTFASGDEIYVEWSAPIVGLEFTLKTSDGYDGRLISVIASNPTSSITGSLTDVTTWGTETQDTTSSFNPTNGVFTVPSQGNYSISGSFLVAATLSIADRFVEVDLVVNGSSVRSMQVRATINNTNIGVPFNFDYPLNAGDLVKLQIVCNGTAPSFNAGSSWNYMHIKKLQSSQAISLNTVVSAKYENTAGTTMSGSFTDVPFVTKLHDTHNAWDGTDEYVCPEAGFYSVSGSLNYQNGSYTAGHYIEVAVFKNSTKVYAATQGTAATATNFVSSVFATEIECVAGNRIKIQARNDAGRSLVAAAGYNTISISKIK